MGVSAYYSITLTPPPKLLSGGVAVLVVVLCTSAIPLIKLLPRKDVVARRFFSYVILSFIAAALTALAVVCEPHSTGMAIFAYMALGINYLAMFGTWVEGYKVAKGHVLSATTPATQQLTDKEVLAMHINSSRTLATTRLG